MANTIITKNSSTASAVPTSGDLVQGELAVNVTDKRLFTEDSGGNVVEVGTNPSSITLASGTANGVTYLNGSKVLTSGSALTFDGSNFVVNSAAGAGINIAYGASSTNYYDANTQIWRSGSFVEGMRLTSTGLGIGTSSITSGANTTTLEVANATTARVIINSTGGRKWGAYTTSSDGRFGIYDYTASADRLIIDSSGNLGLGVTPSAWGSTYKGLQLTGGSVISNSTGDVRLYQNTYFDGSVNKYINTAGASFYYQSAGAHSWFTAPSGTAGNAISFTQAMTLNASGQLGIGTTSPAYQLDVYKSTTDPQISIRDGAGDNSTSVLSLRFGHGYAGTAGSVIGSGKSGVWGGATSTWNSDLRFSTTSSGTITERVRIDSDGNVGIGTSAPTTKVTSVYGLSAAINGASPNATTALTLAGGDTNVSAGSGTLLQFRGIIARGGVTAIGGVYEGTNKDGSFALAFYRNSGNGTIAEAMRLDSSGNLGIGTSSPLTKLHAMVSDVSGYSSVQNDGILIERAGGTAALNIATDSNQSGAIWFGDSGGAAQGQIVYSHSSDALYFGTAGTERARIDSSGNLLVGTTSSLNNGRFSLNFTGSNGAVLQTDSTATQYQIQFYNPNGRVGIISTSGSATVYNTSSDYRLKNTIAPMTGALAKVAALKPVTYKWNADGSDGEGFIAHELAEVVPQCVTGEKDAVDADGNPVYQGIDTSFLVATLTAAIQELKAEFDAYKASHP